MKFFLSREAGNFKSLFVHAALLWSCIPISQNQGRERLGCGEELAELLDGISVVGQRLLVVRQVPREGPKIETTFVEDVDANEPPPLDGVEDANGKGFVNEDGLAKVAAELVSGHKPVIIQFVMQLDGRVVDIKEAVSSEFSLGKATDLLQRNDVKMNCLI